MALGAHLDTDPTVSVRSYHPTNASVSLGNQATFSMIREKNGGTISYRVTLQQSRTCSKARFALRFLGPSLVGVYLQKDTHNPLLMTGNIKFPREGTYTLQARWIDCETGQLRDDHKPLRWISSDPHESSSSSWVQKLTILDIVGVKNVPEYVWMDPSLPITATSLVASSDSVVIREGSAPPPHGFYKFEQLGNYELVCFMGNQTMNDIRNRFLDMRGALFPLQRPFKFHYYSMASFEQPDSLWTFEEKSKFRKCKHFLVSLDELEPALTQKDFQDKARVLIHHLMTVRHDWVEPIWILGSLESLTQTSLQPRQCTQPHLLPSTDHPCNDALRDIFRDARYREQQVHFWDLRDLVLPQTGDNRAHVLSTIALQLYVVIGRGVAWWRSIGFTNDVRGIYRNGTLEKNFDLIPYDWSA